jgi:hypothetical protein
MGYKGNGVHALRFFLDNAMKADLKQYARYAAIVQSSGTGKSRLVHEVANTIFSIPINLRAPTSAGVTSLPSIALLDNVLNVSCRVSSTRRARAQSSR